MKTKQTRITKDSFSIPTDNNPITFGISPRKPDNKIRYCLSVLLAIFITFYSLAVTAATYYISPNGNDAANGDMSHPFATLSKAWTKVVAGDLIYVRGGTYVLATTSTQTLSGKNGIAGNLIKVWAYPGEKPVFDYSSINVTKNLHGFYLYGVNYIHVKGIRITNLVQYESGPVDGFRVNGSNNIIENCEVDHCGAGFNINNTGNNNEFINCDSHHNSDPYDAYEDANGFCGGGIGTIFRSCRAWFNCDDGFDFYGSEGTFILDNCWAFWNGYLEGFVIAGNGMGFKLGPTANNELSTVKKTLTNCLAFENRETGFDKNGGKHAYVLYNNVAYKNGKGGFCTNLAGTTSIVRNNISYANVSYQAFVNSESTVDHNTFLASGSSNSAYSVSNLDFESINSSGMDGARSSDGNLPILSFLHLVANSDLINTGFNVGLPYNGASPDLGPYEFSNSNLNNSPFIQNQIFSINENSPDGTPAGTVVATDPDAGQTLSYSILSGNTNSAFAINATSGAITVASSSALNFEVITSFALIVKVQDNGAGNLSSQATITINVLNINELPFVSNQAFSLNENSANGTIVGNVIASDPDAGQILSYSILSGNTNSAFAINATSGAITVATSSALNFEVITSFALIVKVQDNGTASLNSQSTISITLLNINEAPVANNQAFSIIELSAVGTLVGTVLATDPDVGQILSFAIISGNTNNAFNINSSSGAVTVASSTALNFLTNPVFNLNVWVIDNGTGSLTDDAVLTINVTQIVNLPPVINNQTFSVNENSASGLLIGNVLASDPNAGQILTYSIVSGNTNNAFQINGATGALSVAASSALNYEVVTSYTLIIKVQDNGIGNLSCQGNIYVTLLNLNEQPIINNQAFSIMEFAATGAIVGTVLAVDPDAGQILSFSISSGNTSNAFSINASTGTIIVATSTVLNFLSNPVFNLIVRTIDNGTGNLYGDAIMTINVIQGGNHPPVINNQSFSVNENSANGILVGNVMASDPDAGQTKTFSIMSGNSSNAFTINSSTGSISVANSTALNYEVITSFALIVKVQDNGPGTLSSTATITINIKNINEYPIVYNQSFNVAEFAPKGTIVGTVVASDPDAGQTLSYSITAGNTSNAFSILSSSGKIKVNSKWALNYSINPFFYLTIRVKDNGTGQLASYSTVTINVIDGKSANMLRIVSVPLDTVTAGTLYSYQVQGFPGSSKSIYYSSDVLPNWLSLNDNGNGSATLYGTPGIEDIGNYQIILKGNDSVLEVHQDFTIAVKTVSLDLPVQKSTGMHIYPNPVTNGILNVKFNDVIHEQFQLSIMDLSGRLLLQKDYGQTNFISLDLSIYPPALYQIHIRSLNFQFSEKFIIR